MPITLEEPENYAARAEIMWASTIAHNGFLGTGRVEDWASHAIEHELSGIYDVAHGAGLAVVFPAWMQYVYKKNLNRFSQFTVRVWDSDGGSLPCLYLHNFYYGCRLRRLISGHHPLRF